MSVPRTSFVAGCAAGEVPAAAAWMASEEGRRWMEFEYLQLEVQPTLTGIAILLATGRGLRIEVLREEAAQ